jgi:putative nucleotidyltransferase with HDIG domain
MPDLRAPCSAGPAAQRDRHLVKLTLGGPRNPPRLVVRTLVATSVAIGIVLVAVFVVLSMDAQRRLTDTALDTLESAQRTFDSLEQQRQQDILVQLNALAENPGLTSVVAAYRPDVPLERGQPLQRELDRLASQLGAEALVVTDAADRIVASAGTRRAAFLPDTPLRPEGASDERGRVDEIIKRPSALFRASGVDLRAVNPALGLAYVATALDDGHAAKLSTLLRTQITVIAGGDIVGSTHTSGVRNAFIRHAASLPSAGLRDLADEPHAVRRLNGSGPVAFYAAESVGAHRAARNTFQMLAVVALGAMALGGLASLWLARSLARPIDQLSQRLRQIAEARDFSQKIPRTGSSRELDAFTDTFNQMVTSLQAAEAQTELAYVGAIKALAAALDARDAYTAGHSERVSALSVMIGRQMGLDQSQLDVLRLGALLHDIGKIGVADRVLQKNGPLTQEEFEIIKAHPTLGAHILRQITFLTPHIPIVELHHERPDGRGYPQGLLGHATPLLARIVHVADAFDAMTTARAYRPAQTPTHAIAELWRYAGSQFDAEVVEAFVTAWSAVPVADDRPDVAAVLEKANVLVFERDETRRASNQ